MTKKFEELAEYNTRKSQGIMHHVEYMCKMMKLQKEFDEWREKNEM